MKASLYEELDKIFHPGCMASVGASSNMANMGMGFLFGYKKLGFSGKLYAIHPTKRSDHFETYPGLLDVPGPIDEVKVSIPARLVPGVMKDCVKKGVRCVTIFSSGFRESGTAEGEALEDEVVRIAGKGGVRVIGPNCMGIYCPETGMSIRADMPKVDGGKIALISQSGGIAISFSLAAGEKGVGLSKVVSYGNECDLGAPEFLHYLARDKKTEVICLYIEGTRRAGELFSALKDAAEKKPVVILKGGSTDVGNRAVASHTGALTGSSEVWNAIARQTKAIMAEDTDEMLDLAILLSLVGPPPGRRIGLLTISGGFGVFATDQVVRAGFEMPLLAKQTQKALFKFIDAPGTSIQNPVDMAAKFFQPQHYAELFPAFDKDPGVDAFILVCAMEYLTILSSKTREWSTAMVKTLINGLNYMKKPVYIVLLHTAEEVIRLEHEHSFLAAGYPVFPTVNRCLLAMQRSMERK